MTMSGMDGTCRSTRASNKLKSYDLHNCLVEVSNLAKLMYVLENNINHILEPYLTA